MSDWRGEHEQSRWRPLFAVGEAAGWHERRVHLAGLRSQCRLAAEREPTAAPFHPPWVLRDYTVLDSVAFDHRFNEPSGARRRLTLLMVGPDVHWAAHHRRQDAVLKFLDGILEAHGQVR